MTVLDLMAPERPVTRLRVVGGDGASDAPVFDPFAPVDHGEYPDRFTAGGDFIFDVPDTPQSIWGDGDESLWQQGESLMIVAPIGVGKTTLASQLLRERLGLGTGRLLDFPVEATDKRILYVAADRPAQISRANRRLYEEADRAALNDRLDFWRGPLPFDLAKEPDRLAEFVADRGAGEVWLDSLKDVAMDLSKDETGSRVNNAFQRCLAGGIEVVLLHHQRKAGANNPKPKALDDVYGSTWVPAGAGSVLLLWGQAGDPVVELSHLKPPAEAIGPLKVLHDFTAGTSRRYDTLDAFGILRELRETTAQGMAQQLYGPQAGPNEVEKARRKLNKLAERGAAAKQAGLGQEPAVYRFTGGSQ